MTNYTCYNTAISVEPYNNDGQKSNLNGKVCEDWKVWIIFDSDKQSFPFVGLCGWL